MILERSDRFIAKGTVSQNSDKVSFEFVDGRPVSRHLVEVGLVPEGGDQCLGFWVDSPANLEDLAKEFEVCTGPIYRRTGLLKLGRQAICGAQSRFAAES
jgi:hypothetical protein